MTDPMAATPGWVDQRLETVFAALPEALRPAGDAFAECLARSKSPAAPSDNLGSEFTLCHDAFHRAMLHANVPAELLRTVMADLDALEAEIAADS